MCRNHVPCIKDCQPHVYPIVRGKARTKVESGAKQNLIIGWSNEFTSIDCCISYIYLVSFYF